MIKKIVLFSLFVLPMSLSLMNSTSIPNGLVNSKELAGYLIAALFLLIASNRSFRGNKIILNKLDYAIFFLLVIIPSLQLIFMNVSVSSLIRSYMITSIYFCVRIIAMDFNLKARLLSFYSAAFTISILNILISSGQYFDFIESNHNLRGISGMFFNPGPFAIYLASLTILNFTLINYFRLTLNYRMMCVSIIAALCLICIILQLYSRTAWVAILAGVLLLYYCSNTSTSTFYTKLRVIRILFIPGALLIPLIFWLNYLRPDSVNGRRLIWNSTLEMIKSNPLVGVGLGRFKAEYANFQSIFLEKDNINMMQFGSFADETNYAFNDFLQLVSEQGVLGLGLCVYVVALCCKIFRSNTTNMPLEFKILYNGILISIIVILIAGFTSYPFQLLPITALFWTALALCNVDPGVPNGDEVKERYRKVLGYSKMSLAAAFFCIFSVKAYSYKIWQQSIERNIRKDELLQIYIFLNDDADFNNHLAHRYFLLKQYKQALKFFHAATLYKFEKDHIYDLGRCLERLGDFRGAKHQYEMIQSSIPNLDKPKYLIAKSYLSMGNLDEFNLKSAEFLASSKKSKNFEIQLMRQELTSLIYANQIKFHSSLQRNHCRD